MSTSLLNFSLLSGKLKIISLASVSALTLTATTIGVTANKSKIQSASFNKVKDEVNKLPGLIKSTFHGAMPALSNQYKSATQNISEHFKSSSNALSQEFNKAANSTSDTYKYLNENKSEINFYAFALGNLIKPLIGNIRIIIRDSFVYNQNTKKHQQLLSIQKIIQITSKPNFKKFSEKIRDIVKEKISIIEQMTVEDGLGIIKIFREVREDDFNLFMNKVTQNAEQISQDKNKTYKTAEELFKDLFIGINECQKSKEKVNTLINEVEKGKEVISEAEIKKIKEILETLKKSFESTNKQSS